MHTGSIKKKRPNSIIPDETYTFTLPPKKDKTKAWTTKRSSVPRPVITKQTTPSKITQTNSDCTTSEKEPTVGKYTAETSKNSSPDLQTPLQVIQTNLGNDQDISSVGTNEPDKHDTPDKSDENITLGKYIRSTENVDAMEILAYVHKVRLNSRLKL